MNPEDLFWQLAGELYADEAVTRSTMMGFPCLRVKGAFFASLDHHEHHLIVKLSAGRVNEIVEAEDGLSFAPNGRVFREWVAIPEPDEDSWRNYLLEAKAFATSNA
ncbi:hypothetical protein BH23CHL2_BH23CHL2_14490 [soil metagenome]